MIGINLVCVCVCARRLTREQIVEWDKNGPLSIAIYTLRNSVTCDVVDIQRHCQYHKQTRSKILQYTCHH